MPVSPSANNVIACLGGDKTALEPRPVPAVGAGEMLLKLRVVGFCGTDLFKLDTGAAAPGTVLGHELVGEVIEAAPDVAEFRKGDRVAVPHHVPCGECLMCRRGNETMCETFRENLMAPGGFADTVLIRPRAVAHAAKKVPDGVTDAAAVFMEPAACVLRGIDRSDIAGDGAAVVQGGGSMGLLHLLLLKAARPGIKVAVVDPRADRQEAALKLGADAATEPGDAAKAAVGKLTNGAGADAVFDTVGGPGPLQAALALTRQGGSVVLFAHAKAGARADFDLNDLFKHERRIIGTYSGALREQDEVFRLIASGAFDPSPLVTHTLPLDDFQEGVALARTQRALKVLFTPSRAAAEGR